MASHRQTGRNTVHPNRNRLRASSVMPVATLLMLLSGITTQGPAHADEPLFDTWRSFDLAAFEAQYPSDGKVADFDNDGDADLAVVYRSQLSKLTLMFNNGDGTFGEPTHYPAEVSYCVESADLDSDGDEDIVSRIEPEPERRDRRHVRPCGIERHGRDQIP